MTGLTKDDSSRLGFVMASLVCRAINFSELKQWAEGIIVSTEEYPLWLVDLYELEDSSFSIVSLIGFNPTSDLSEVEVEALTGIAIARGRIIDTTVISQRRAVDAVQGNKHVIDMFKDEFPELADSIDESVAIPFFEDPWEPVTSDYSGELVREVTIGHPLYKVPTMSLARHVSLDDFLFKVEDGTERYAVVHLTWRIETDPRWPVVTFYDSLDDFYTSEN